ncbi:MAG: 30S ribosomal protein S19 [Candidatus Aenigmatarchaeota archaeon]|nr:MAG: 30S ribosomal protein S19 [Candidatus Aenigmarchaeota archaeon]
MADFIYKGKKPKELSREEFIELLPSEIRRKFKRGLPEEESKLLVTLDKFKEQKGRKFVKTHCRSMIVLPEMIGHKIGIHNGKEFVAIDITEELVGRRLGEFALTRKALHHGSAGIGASKGTKFSASKK